MATTSPTRLVNIKLDQMNMKAIRFILSFVVVLQLLSCEKEEARPEGMGDWVEISTDTIYEATTDGFLYGYSLEQGSNQCSGHVANVYIGSSADSLNLFLQAENQMRFTLPVTKGSFYQVTISASSWCTIQNPKLALSWMPLH